MRVLWFNLAWDRADPVLGFATRWVEEVARRVDSVHVVPMRLGAIGDLPSNVTVASVGKERGWSEARRFVEFERILAAQGRRGGADVVFAHMMPLFVILAAPWCRRRRIPQVLWYAHGSVTRRLRLAARLSARVVTSTPAGFRLPRPAPICLGQGIDTVRFACDRAPGLRSPVRVLIAGRLSPVKRVRESIEAVGRAASVGGAAWEILVAGAPATSADEDYARSLRQNASTSRTPVKWMEGVPHDSMPGVYREADFLVNLSETGSLDKVILEALAAGCLPVSSNAAFRDDVDGTPLGRLVVDPTAEAAGKALADLARQKDHVDALRRDGRAWVVRNHGLERLVERLVEVLREVQSAGRVT